MWAGYRSARRRRGSGAASSQRVVDGGAGSAGGKHKTRALWTARHGMQTLIALLVAAAAACAIARPPGPTAAPLSLQVQHGPQMVRVPLTSSHDYLVDYILAKFVLPHRLGYEESPRVPQLPPQNDWLNKEIDRINQMNDDEELPNLYEVDVPSWIRREPYVQRMLPAPAPLRIQESIYTPETIRTSFEDLRPMNIPAPPPMLMMPDTLHEVKREPETIPAVNPIDISRKRFALTPMDKEYYKQSEENVHRSGIVKSKAVEPATAHMVLEPPRQTRQNPNLSKQKHLLEPDIGKLKIGLTNKDYRLPVSLLPTNLRWLKLTKPDNNIDDYERSHEEERGKQVQVAEAGGGDPAESIYGVAVIAAVGAALAMALIGFGFGWYTLSKKAKAAADVDYPAYGVTGPTMDTSGDRKLAHSAHMYHYQHQKQQIIAMERHGLDQRAGSVSDPESEEENEEGDYTVYECPGFATTGDMEVKNPLFSDDPTPTAAGKCEVVKPQPKD